MATVKAVLIGILLSGLIMPPANAYLDPGSGSLLIQSIFAAFAAVVVFFGHFKSTVMGVIRRLFRNKRNL